MYTIRLRAVNPVTSTNFLDLTFNVNIKVCTITKAYTGSLAYQYDIFDPAEVIDFSTALTYSTSCTGKGFTYSATLADGSPLPSFITFDPLTKKFTVDSSVASDAGTYAVKVKATLDDGSGTFNDDFVFDIVAVSNLACSMWYTLL